MPIQVTNTLSGNKETLTTLKPNELKMYVCGPTVYNFTHIGNARPVVFFDIVRRFLEFSGYKVTFVMNYTDVDDKIINRAREEKTTASDVSERYTKAFEADMSLLGVRPPDQAPKVSKTIPQIISFIEGLIKNGAAYVAEDGEVFYAVRKFPTYGKLSGKKIDDLIAGARVAPDEKKRDPLDFSLWKPRKTEDEPAWQSPWCMGRPGWHIECSAMSYSTLGETFDLHGGGTDLIHPHHENEIAQSEAFTGKPFVTYWMHSNMLSFNAEKMSKSLGNILLTRDFVPKHTAEVLRFMLLSAHYRSMIDFSEKHTRECQSALHRIYSTLAKVQGLAGTEIVPDRGAQVTTEETALADLGKKFKASWVDAMSDDFNTAKVLGFVFDYIRAVNALVDRKGFKLSPTSKPILEKFGKDLAELSNILNLFGEEPAFYLQRLKATVLKERGMQEGEILLAIDQRIEARTNKDFATADNIRKELLAKGIELRDSPTGTEWDIAFTVAP